MALALCKPSWVTCGFLFFMSWNHVKMASSLSQWLKYTKNEPPKMARPLSQWLKYTPIYANGLGTRLWFAGFYFLCPEIMSKWQVGLASGLNTKLGLASGLNIPKHTMNIEWACLGPTSNDSLRFCLFELAWARSSPRPVSYTHLRAHETDS